MMYININLKVKKIQENIFDFYFMNFDNLSNNPLIRAQVYSIMQSNKYKPNKCR